MSTIYLPTRGGRFHVWGRADRLRAAREGMDGSPDRKAFAALTGIGRNTVARYEHQGNEGQSRALVATWATFTGYDFHWLWTGEEPSDGDPDASWAPCDSNAQPADTRSERHLRLAA